MCVYTHHGIRRHILTNTPQHTHTSSIPSVRPYLLPGHELEPAEDDAVAAGEQPRVALDLLVHLRGGARHLGFDCVWDFGWFRSLYVCGCGCVGVCVPIWRAGVPAQHGTAQAYVSTDAGTHGRTHHVAHPVELARDGALDVGAEEGRGGADHADDVAAREEAFQRAVGLLGWVNAVSMDEWSIGWLSEMHGLRRRTHRSLGLMEASVSW